MANEMAGVFGKRNRLRGSEDDDAHESHPGRSRYLEVAENIDAILPKFFGSLPQQRTSKPGDGDHVSLTRKINLYHNLSAAATGQYPVGDEDIQIRDVLCLHVCHSYSNIKAKGDRTVLFTKDLR